MDISVIIVNYNTAGLLKNCLGSIFQYYSSTRPEIIVINNSPQTDCQGVIKDYLPKIGLIENKENIGFSRANNQGVKIASGDILFFLNSDTLLKENIFQKIIETFERDSKIGIIAPRLILPDGSLQPWAYGEEGGLWQLVKNKLCPVSTHVPKYLSAQVPNTDWVSGAALAIRREIFEEAGGFDEKFFMYFEDRDLCRRVKNLGYKIIIVPEIKVIHFGGKSLTRDKQRKKLYYQSQNYYWQKHYGWLKSIIMRLIRWGVRPHLYKPHK